jgi:hypothetical protein
VTELELAQIAALAECRFSPGSAEKRFVRQLVERKPTAISIAQAEWLDKLAHRYRKQIGRCMSVACVVCKKPKMPAISYEVDSRTNTKWGRVRRQHERPTFEQAVAVLESAESCGAKYVHWFYQRSDEVLGASSHVVAIHRCECSEVVLGTNVCRTCQLIASLFVDTDKRGAQVQFERAERALDRVSAMCAELQQKARGAA